MPKDHAMETAPRIDLPARMFADESVSASAGTGRLPLPTLDGKVDLVRDYTRDKPLRGVFDVSEPTDTAVKPVALAIDEKYTVAGALAARKIILRPPSPEYPEWAVKGGLEADMKLRVTVSPDGIVEAVESVESTGYPRMDLVASRYLKEWRFESRPFETESESGIVSVKFRLK